MNVGKKNKGNTRNTLYSWLFFVFGHPKPGLPREKPGIPFFLGLDKIPDQTPRIKKTIKPMENIVFQCVGAK